jgi:hypothetical protein
LQLQYDNDAHCRTRLATKQTRQSVEFLIQSDLNLFTKYGSTFGCQRRHVPPTDLSLTCIGAYYLEDLNTLQQKCEYNLIQVQEHILKIASSQWIIYYPIDFPFTIECPFTLISMTVRSSSTITIHYDHGILKCYFRLTALKNSKLQLHILEIGPLYKLTTLII